MDIQSPDLDTPDNIESDVQFDLDDTRVMKTFIDELYESPESGIRELLTNAISAIRESEVDNGEIHFEVDGGKLVVEDNGIGMSEKRIKKVVTEIGKTTRKNEEEIQGQFGVGFLSYFQLAEEFRMETKSRRTDESIAGGWSVKGFEPDGDGLDDYGTRFVFETSVDESQLEKWIETNAEYARVDVYLNGALVSGESIVPDTQAPTVTYEDEYVKASDEVREFFISSEYSSILMDVPVSYDAEFNLRIKTENATVVSGPNKGEVVGHSIDESELSDEDVLTPEPTTSRDELKLSSEFDDWVYEKINEEKEYYEDASVETSTIVEKYDLDYMIGEPLIRMPHSIYEAEVKSGQLVVAGTDYVVDENPFRLDDSKQYYVNEPFSERYPSYFYVEDTKIRRKVRSIFYSIIEDEVYNSNNLKHVLKFYPFTIFIIPIINIFAPSTTTSLILSIIFLLFWSIFMIIIWYYLEMEQFLPIHSPISSSTPVRIVKDVFL